MSDELREFTVIGFYEDSYQRYCGVHRAKDAEAAQQFAAELHSDECLAICAVIEGRHEDQCGGWENVALSHHFEDEESPS